MLHRTVLIVCGCVFFFQAEDGIRDLVRSRGLGDVYKRQGWGYGGGIYNAGAGVLSLIDSALVSNTATFGGALAVQNGAVTLDNTQLASNRAANSENAAGGGCLLYTSPSPRDRTRSRMPSSA